MWQKEAALVASFLASGVPDLCFCKMVPSQTLITPYHVYRGLSHCARNALENQQQEAAINKTAARRTERRWKIREPLNFWAMEQFGPELCQTIPMRIAARNINATAPRTISSLNVRPIIVSSASCLPKQTIVDDQNGKCFSGCVCEGPLLLCFNQ